MSIYPIGRAFEIQSNICGGAFLWNCRRRGPLGMFDSILNGTLSNNLL